jgi:hypothetical protein
MLYIDKERLIFFRGQWRMHVHCTADSLAELHDKMRELGVPSRAFHDKPGAPHYDLFDVGIEVVRAAGAKELARRDLLLQARQCR